MDVAPASTKHMFCPTIPQRWNAPPRSNAAKWFFRGEKLDELESHRRVHPWYVVLWLTGVDYFSTLGYQPGIALLAAGVVSPIATAILVAVTLFGAFPIYFQVASRSYAGQGSIAMLENLLQGWQAKLLVLVLLGFAATDFVITMTLSAADAAQHAIENPFLQPYLGDHRLVVTLVLLSLLAAVFLRGFMEAIGLAVAVAVPYIFLNLVVLGRGVLEVLRHPEYFSRWQSLLFTGTDWTGLLLGATIIFPRLALGMSGFETGVSVMPLVAGGRDERPGPPAGRIRATRKLLGAAALLMAGLLLLSSFVTTLLIPPDAYKIGGKAAGRAIAYLAHGLLGEGFGTLYDISTILILWFAGASAMAGLLNLVPRYLPRFGMAPRWISYTRPLVILLFAADVVVTIIFDANVEAQAGAYATGILVLILSAALAVALALWHEAVGRTRRVARKRLLSLFFWALVAVFAFTLVDNVIERPDGVIIAGFFIAIVIVLSALSRAWRSIELRVSEVCFADDTSYETWPSLCAKKVHLVPLRTSTRKARQRKEQEIRRYYAIKGPIAFVHVNLLDNRSDFMAPLDIRIAREGECFVITVSGAIAIANSIAYLSELIDPISIFLGLTRQSLVTQSLRYLFLGEGETGLMVYAILRSYWEWTPEDDVRPLIFLVSE